MSTCLVGGNAFGYDDSDLPDSTSLTLAFPDGYVEFSGLGGSFTFYGGSGFSGQSFGGSSFYSFEDSPQRKLCLKDSADILRGCLNEAALVAGAQETGLIILSVIVGAGSGGTLGAAVFGVGTALNASLYELEKNQCQNEKEHRDIDCPAGF